jgi:hypothetical protein
MLRYNSLTHQYNIIPPITPRETWEFNEKYQADYGAKNAEECRTCLEKYKFCDYTRCEKISFPLGFCVMFAGAGMTAYEPLRIAGVVVGLAGTTLSVGTIFKYIGRVFWRCCFSLEEKSAETRRLIV